MLRVGALCCGLLLINAILCQFLCALLNNAFPTLFSDLRALQAVMYFGPILLIGIEFWIYDRRVDYLSRHQESTVNENDQSTTANG